MSTEGAGLPDFEFDRDFWTELEVPYGKIQDKWDHRYSRELAHHVQENHLKGRVLRLYLQVLDMDVTARKNTELLQAILDHDEAYGYNMMSQYRFSNRKNMDILKSCYGKIEGDVPDELQENYDTMKEGKDKDGMVAMTQLINPDVLREIIGLDYWLRRRPALVSKNAAEAQEALTDAQVEDIIDHLSKQDFPDYSRWHRFSHDGAEYLMIKRHIDDEVQRQVQENIEEEPAEFVILKFEERQLEVVSETQTVAATAQAGVNRSIEDADYSQVDVGIEYEEFQGVVNQISEGSFEDFYVKGLKTSSAPLPRNPDIEISSKQGITEAIQALKEKQVDLTQNVEDLSRITVVFDERDFNLYPTENELEDGRLVHVLKYGARSLDDDQRKRFEESVEDALGIPVLYEKI